MLPATTLSISPVRKSILVRASVERAFHVYTAGLDSWWPKTHHIGDSPMTRTVLEPEIGGRCYSEQADGSSCQWGRVLAWEPPGRFVMAWQITPSWEFEPDLSKCSEVEVTFRPAEDGYTLVELEHRNFERHGEGGDTMREQVGQDGGWGGLLTLFKAQAEEAH
jgi:uncharacterized protein YndB with AHSA1/START domain